MTMGGDDLGSDEEFLTGNIRIKDDEIDGSSSLVIDDDSASAEKKKRKRTVSDDGEDQNDHDAERPQKKQQLLLESSRNILELSLDQQAKFLLEALSHYTKMSVDDSQVIGSSSNLPPLPSVKRLSRQLSHAKSNCSENQQDSFLNRLLSVSSKKRLKRHSAKGSPSILIVCQSARRAVAILKECVPLHTKAAKLFPKQGTVTHQLKECSQSPFGLAVGTPQRLAALFGMSETDTKHGDDGDNLAPLRLDATQLVILDAEPSNKKYTVCTLPDTAQWCMKFVQTIVLPELRKRKDIKLAFC